jgi:hypothetical protein
MKFIKAYESFFGLKRKKGSPNANPDVEKLKTECKDKISDSGYHFVDGTAVKNSLHIKSNNGKFYALINKSSGGYSFCVRETSDPYDIKELYNDEVKSLDEIFSILKEKFKG